jgi:hypothetical protein
MLQADKHKSDAVKLKAVSHEFCQACQVKVQVQKPVNVECLSYCPFPYEFMIHMTDRHYHTELWECLKGDTSITCGPLIPA